MLIFLFFILAACSHRPVMTTEISAHRCPASQSCKALLPFSYEPIKVSLPIPITLQTSTLSELILQSMERLEMPEAFDERNLKLILIELTYSQFIEAYRELPAAEEYTEILLNRKNLSADELRSSLNEWIKKSIPGYSFAWNKPGEDNVIEESRFFRMLKSRQIPVADHHDLLVHPYHMLDPEIRNLTERIADIHVKAQQKDDSVMMRIANLLWTRLQEYTPVEYRDSKGQRRITVIGGGPSLVTPFNPAMGNLEGWNYLSGSSELYFKLQYQLDHGPFKNDPKARLTFESIVRHIEKIIDILPGYEPEFVFKEMESIPHVLSGYFTDATAATYGEHWKAFSKMILSPQEETSLATMHPQNHRKLMRMSVELTEILIGTHSP